MKPASLLASSRRSAFLVPFGIVLIGANLRAPITSVGPVLADIQADLALSDSAAGLLNSLPLFVFALLSLVAPLIGRKLGAGRGLGAALAVILLGMCVRCVHGASGLWIGTLLLSSGIAVGNVLLPGLVKREYPQRAGSLIAIYAATMAAFAGIGAGLAAPVAHLPGADWRAALTLPAVLTVMALVVWLPAMRDQHPAAARQARPTAKTRSPWKQAIGWHVSAFFAFQSLVFYALVSWYATISVSRGQSASDAGFALLLYQVVAIATNLGAAPMIKRMKDQRALGVLCGALLLVGTTGMASSVGPATLWLTIAGLGAGFSMTTSLSLFALRAASHEQAGELSGMAQCVGYAGAAVGPALFGFIHQATDDWTFSLDLLVAASVAVMVFAFLAGRARTMI
ncbi:MFS transporter [Caballeronia sp. LZ034LL]|uniref:CynX/NimT family MFS transporter n=1 Tax=Caballeronia sp. LZ034LL TaxID=3038567 RepID=UPI00285EE637|nr:MFS transporter [Caballeronia sp. LZ034LL]MDR5838262.1 MFS transporter [Caballeronia sp. LZ034LL]